MPFTLKGKKGIARRKELPGSGIQERLISKVCPGASRGVWSDLGLGKACYWRRGWCFVPQMPSRPLGFLRGRVLAWSVNRETP